MERIFKAPKENGFEVFSSRANLGGLRRLIIGVNCAGMTSPSSRATASRYVRL